MPVRLLTPETIGKIAAGEVVERPASVVKELLENALDAGARRIAIEIRDGGNELIEVADDGKGIAVADLPLAVQRHATSKLTSFEDLDRLRTLGFRGEALPSVGAVAALAIRTRPAGQAVGATLAVTYGEVGPVLPAAASDGTTIAVRDLFANVPARRKFLRQSSTEAAYIARAVGAYALAYPEVAFSLTSDGRRVLTTDGRGDLPAAAVGVHGPDLSAATLPLEPLDEAAAVPGVSVSGWVAQPSISRSHRQGLAFFVNGRWIQNRALGFALEEAYHSLLTVGRHPLALVRIELDPAGVDVNVHPTKAEVKFLDERAVCRAVQRAAHAALAAGPHARLPEIRFDAAPPMRQRDLGPALPVWGGAGAMGNESSPAAATNGHEPVHAQTAAHPSGVPILRVLGQVAATYIIAEGPDGMYLIDQHAAHERVMYERFLTQLTGQAVDRQALLDPLVVDLAPDELAAFERSRRELEQLGFEIEPFGEGAVAIRAVPAIVQGVDPAERLRLILRELADGGAGDSWLDAVAISAACHTSIRAGQALSLPEMRELVAELERTQQPRACGHGRPTMLHLTQGELERQFARR
jgi:DNA mismatch repair protein MutL